jgi:hypothetical protein
MKNRIKEVIINMNELCNIVVAKITDDYVTKGTIYHIKSYDDFGFIITNEVGEKLSIGLNDKDFVFLFNIRKSDIDKIRNIIIEQ